MGLTHRDLAAYVEALYSVPDSVPWLYRSNPDANVYMGLIRQDGALIVVTRGSFDLEDWFHDFMARPINPAGRPEIKKVHQGFYGGTPEAWDIISDYVADDDLIFAGHSLGAARGVVLAAHAVANGHRPRFVCCWGEPAPMFPEGNVYLAGVPGASYRNVTPGSSDPVTKSTLPFGYAPRLALTDCRVTPDSHGFDLFALHHFALYQGATPATEIP